MRVLCFADASASIGTGHVMRSLVLARELMDRSSKVLVAGSGVNELSKMSASFGPIPTTECRNVFESQERISLIKKFAPDAVVIDGYGFQRELFDYLDNARIKYLIIDDNGESRATKPRAVINVSPHAPEELYKERFPESSLYLGSEFALIRREILEAGKNISERHGGFAFVSLGGSDVAGLSLSVASIVSEMNIEARVALGSQVIEREKVAAAIRRLSNVELIEQKEFDQVFAQASLAIISAGSTLWEAIYLGLPTVAVVVAENQISHAAAAATEYENIAVVDFLNEPRPEEVIRKSVLRLRRSFADKTRFPPRQQSGAAKLARLIRRDLAL